MDSTYVSAFQILSGFYDFKIEFSTIEPLLDENGEVIKDERILKHRITMPPALTKELAQKLTKMVEGYEARFGEIKGFPDDEEE